MTVRSTHHHIARGVAVVVAGAVFGVTGTLAVTAARPAQLAPQQQYADLVEWARTQHLTGLSPASLGVPCRNLHAGACHATDLATIAKFAVAEGLTGLSPASLHPIRESRPGPDEGTGGVDLATGQPEASAR